MDKAEIFSNIAMRRNKVSDRAVLRAIHFYKEQEHVLNAVSSLENNSFADFLEAVKNSGASSAKNLQNIYSLKNPHAQNVTVALALSEIFLGENGVCRVHGGGFAGTIQAFVKNNAVANYKENIENVFGKDSCHVLKVRPYGGIVAI